MPNYKTHDTVGLALTPAIIAGGLYLLPPLYAGVFVSTYIFSTFYLSPDLDLHSRVYNRWGLLRFIWYPYRKLIHHRSWLSHSGPISATIRLLYLTLWLLPLLFLIPVPLLHLAPFYAILWISIICSDTIHVFMDTIWRD